MWPVLPPRPCDVRLREKLHGRAYLRERREPPNLARRDVSVNRRRHVYHDWYLAWGVPAAERV